MQTVSGHVYWYMSLVLYKFNTLLLVRTFIVFIVRFAVNQCVAKHLQPSFFVVLCTLLWVLRWVLDLWLYNVIYEKMCSNESSNESQPTVVCTRSLRKTCIEFCTLEDEMVIKQYQIRTLHNLFGYSSQGPKKVELTDDVLK